MNNDEEKYFYNKKKSEKESTNNIIEDLVYDELFIAKTSNQKHVGETFIEYSSATSHMVNSEENMTNLKNSKTRVTIRDSRTLIRKKRGDWHSWQKYDRRLH